jgi:hypothetical protein
MLRRRCGHPAILSLALPLLLGLTACGESSGPDGLAGRLAIRPVFSSAGAAGIVDIASTRIRLARVGGGLALDTVVVVPPGADSVTLVAQVALNSSNESFVLTVAFITPAGDTAFVGGPITIQVGLGAGAPVPVDIPTTYVGVGANAAGVRITNRGAFIPAGGSTTLAAEAFDSLDQVIPNTPIAWRSLDPAATVPDPAVGLVVGSLTGGSARIVAALLTGPADTLTAQVGAAGLTRLFHASGISDFIDPDSANSGRWLEIVDPLAQAVFPPLATSRGLDEIVGLAYDPTINRVYATDQNCQLISIDPANGAETGVGYTGGGIDTCGGVGYLKGLAWDAAGNRLLGGVTPEFGDGVLYAIDPTNAATDSLGQVVTTQGDSLDGFNGFAMQPSTGILYVIGHRRVDALQTRTLMTLNVATFTATIIAQLPQSGVAGITFTSGGILYAVTGDGGQSPETLWTMNLTTAAMTLVMPLGHGDDGEAIVAVPAAGGNASAR